MNRSPLLLVILVAGLAFPAHAQGTLKDRYASQFDVGVAIPPPDQLTPAEQALLLANFTNITPENCMKPESTEPREGVFTFAEADRLADFAKAHGLKVNGHCLVWHSQTPDWFFTDNGKPAGRDLVLKRMKEHIAAEMTHFKGRVVSWDVVNEALDDGHGYLRPSKWEKCIGPDYIAQAFRAAAQADPQAELYYNDYAIERQPKRNKALRLIRELKKAGVRIDGIGIQCHWHLDSIPYRQLDEAIRAFHAQGLKVMLTEVDLDVIPGRKAGASADPFAKACPPQVLKREAEQYGALFALINRDAPMISRVTFWGLQDARSWLTGPGHTNYPLPWGRDLQPKPALQAILNAK